MFAYAVRRIALALAALVTCAPAAMGQPRTWTDDAGKFSVEAELVEVQGDNVILKKASGAEISLPITRLSETDHQYLDALAREQTIEPVGDQGVNLTQTARYTASSTWDDTTYSASKAFDGLPNTRWNSRGGNARGAWLAAQWDKPVTIRRAVVRQAFDRITGLKLQVFNDTAKTWKTVVVLDGKELTRQKRGQAGRDANDGTVNPIFAMQLSAPVQTTGLRLLITSVVPMLQGTVSVFELEAFGEPTEDAAEISPEVAPSLAKHDARPSVRNGRQATLTFPDAVTEPPSWNDANTPFDLAAFLKALPPEENAAPLYLDAFYEFAPLDMIDLLYPDLSQEELKRRYDSFRPRWKEGTRLEEAWEKDPKSVDAKVVDAWLANFDVAFEKLAAAQQRPKCMFQPGRSVHSLWPHIQAARGVYRVVAWRSRRDIQRGDLERPLQDLKMLLRLRHDLQVRGGLIAQLVAFAFDGRCCELVRTLLNAPGVNTRQCDRLLALLADHEAKSIDAFVEGNRADYISMRQAVYDLQHRTGTFDPQFMRDELAIDGDVTSPIACIRYFTDLDLNPQRLAPAIARFQGRLRPGAWQGGKMLSDEDYAKEVAALNRYFATILALAEQPNFRRKGEADLKSAEAPILETTLASFVILPQRALLQAILRTESHLRGPQCLVALRRWQLEHAEAPPDLETLVKAAGMPSVPMDPYSDQPLRLGSVAGKPVIYSVGPDGKDDNAQIEWNQSRDGPGDFIFRLETPLQ